MEANQELNNLYQNSNNTFCFTRIKKEFGKDLERGRWLKGRNGRLRFIVKEDRAKIWKEHIKKIMNQESK